MAAIAAYRCWKHALLWGGVLLLLMARVPLLWQTGEFVSEDGWVFFAGAFNAPWYESILTPFAGYFRIEARLLAEFLSGLSLIRQPYGFALGGLAINAAMLVLFYAPRFRSVLPDDGHRGLIVLLLALAPNAENLGLVTGQHWYVAFAFTLLLVMESPTRLRGRIAMVAGSSLAIWSAPAVLVLWPLLAFAVARSTPGFPRLWKTVALIQLTLAGLAVMVFSGTEGGRAGEFVMSQVPLALEHLLVRGWVWVGLLGRWLGEVTINHVPLVADGGGLMIILGLVGLLWRHRQQDGLRALVLLMLAAGGMAMASLWRTAYIGELANADLPLHERYLTVPTLLLIVVVGVLFFRLANPRRLTLVIVFTFQAVLFVTGWSRENHWARAAGEFRLRDYAAEIERFQHEVSAAGYPASLYVPSPIPYWGLVLESGGGYWHHPDAGVLDGVRATHSPDGGYESWLGRFEMVPTGGDVAGNEIEHERWGRLRYTGTEAGRVWFVDAQARQLFTSKLLYPYAWRIGPTRFTLIAPSPSEG